MDDPFGSVPIGAKGVRKQRSQVKLESAANIVPDAITAQLERTPSPEFLVSSDMTAASLRTQLQALLEDKSTQLTAVGTMGQMILAQQTELEQRIHALMELDGDSEEIGDDTRGKLLELQTAMKTWDSSNQGLMRELQAPQVCNTWRTRSDVSGSPNRCLGHSYHSRKEGSGR